jgi:hypothetical protein
VNDLTEALRRAAATPTHEPSVAELQRELRDRQRRRRVAGGVFSGVAVVATSAILVAALGGGDRRIVNATGHPAPARTTQAPFGRAHLGDGFCEPHLTNAGYRITPAPADVIPTLTLAAAIDRARVYVSNGSGSFHAYLAMVRNPLAANVGLGTAEVPRTTWVVEVSNIVSPSPGARGPDRDPSLRPGVANPSVSDRMVAFIDDATGTQAGAWSGCSDEPPTSVAPAGNTVDIPNLRGQQVTEASAKLRQLGLQVAVEERRTPDVPRGIVMAQDPLPGSRSMVGSQVILQVSSGP